MAPRDIVFIYVSREEEYVSEQTLLFPLDGEETLNEEMMVLSSDDEEDSEDLLCLEEMMDSDAGSPGFLQFLSDLENSEDEQALAYIDDNLAAITNDLQESTPSTSHTENSFSNNVKRILFPPNYTESEDSE